MSIRLPQTQRIQRMLIVVERKIEWEKRDYAYSRRNHGQIGC